MKAGLRMATRKTLATSNCILCKGPAGGENRTREHIFPEALGGRRTVTGFICRTCNNQTGSTWDATLVKGLEDVARLLNISRTKGPVRPKTINTSQGLPLKVSPRNRIELAHPHLARIAGSDGKEYVRVMARHEDDLRAIADTISKRRHHAQNADAVMAESRTTAGYLQEGIGYSINLPEGDANRSLVKSLLALAFAAGINPTYATTAIKFLTDPEAPPCVFRYYSTDLIDTRIPDMPLNCLYVKGDPAAHQLVGYVEILGFIRRVVRLSDDYMGKHFEDCYAFNPIDGVEQQIAVALKPTIISDAESNPDKAKEEKVLMETLTNFLMKIKNEESNREFDRLISAAISAWYSEHNKDPNDDLTQEERLSLSGRIAQEVAPYALHLMRPMTLPPWATEAASEEVQNPSGE